MQSKKTISSLYPSTAQRRLLWKAAIKWPLYSVAVMPILLATGLRIGSRLGIRIDQLIGFLLASILLLLWENLTNDLFDAETGIDEYNKPHSVVALIGSKEPVKRVAYFALCLGLLIILFLALNSNINVLYLVLGSCTLGYLYQGPPFRWGYKGLGEPLCWIAFGPLATAAALLVISPGEINEVIEIPWVSALYLGSGPALATTLVLFCSHFHQVAEDAAHGKKSPLVRLGTRKSAALVPWIVFAIFVLELIPVINGLWPITTLLNLIGLPYAFKLILLLKNYHNEPKVIEGCKFTALRFQAFNGLGLSLGLGLAPFIGLDVTNTI